MYFPIKNGDIPASYVSLPEGNQRIRSSQQGSSGVLLINPPVFFRKGGTGYPKKSGPAICVFKKEAPLQ